MNTEQQITPGEDDDYNYNDYDDDYDESGSDDDMEGDPWPWYGED
jgi:hypothetical protein